MPWRLLRLIACVQLGITSDDGEGQGCEAASATSSDVLFDDHNVWLKGMRGMLENLTADIDQVHSQSQNAKLLHHMCEADTTASAEQ